MSLAVRNFVTYHSAFVVVQYPHIFQSLPRTNFILSSLPASDLSTAVFTYKSNATDLRQEIDSLGNLIHSFIKKNPSVLGSASTAH